MPEINDEAFKTPEMKDVIDAPAKGEKTIAALEVKLNEELKNVLAPMNTAA